jgi:hypothetical protein
VSPNPEWTATRIDRVRDLAAMGLSARLIGWCMGVTKSSVMGIVQRNGIALSGKKGQIRTKPRATPRRRPSLAPVLWGRDARSSY